MSVQDREITYDSPEPPPPDGDLPRDDEDGRRDAEHAEYGNETTAVDPSRVTLPAVAADADGVDPVVNGEPDQEGDTLILPAVETMQLDGVPNAKEVDADSNGYAESVILEGDDVTLAEALVLPRIEVRTMMGNMAADPGQMKAKNSRTHPKNSRAAIMANKAHSKCFRSVGASGLSRVFTSGNFCPELSSRSMVVKNFLKLPPAVVPSLQASQTTLNTRAPPQMERSKTIADLPRMRSDKSLLASEIMTTSKVSLFSRGGEKAKNLVFGPTVQRQRSDLTKSEQSLSPREGSQSTIVRGAPRLTERYATFVREDTKITEEEERPQSESDELTPSESGIMGTKIHEWFNMGMKQEAKPTRAERRPRKKGHSRNLWDPGMQNRVHRGLSSSILKPNACIGNYLNDVTASRFPQVETRQIVFTR